MELEEPAPHIDLAMERPLFSSVQGEVRGGHRGPIGGRSRGADALFDQIYVDKTRSMAQIRRALQTRHQISLADLVEQFPAGTGLAELVAYLSLATEDDRRGDRRRGTRQELAVGRAEGARGAGRTLPLVIFSGHAAVC